jgi:hypothetical protein
MFPYRILQLLLACACCAACSDVLPEAEHNGSAAPLSKEFDKYWNAGKAEISSYTVKQARYGEIHEGSAVLVFVTEPFLMDKQVKNDNAHNAATVSVLKLNRMRKFPTGIYDYSVMTSVFHPVTAEHALKVTTSVQDWCGHVWTQLNLREGKLNVETRSYFEQEGDVTRSMPAVALEDELWTQIRLAPKQLPTGEFNMVPGTMFARLLHKPVSATNAAATLSPSENGLRTYTLNYPAFQRTLTIHFKADFPHEIEAWEEEYMSGWGDAAKRLVTTAVLNKRLKSDYWNKHTLDDLEMRKSLGL